MTKKNIVDKEESVELVKIAGGDEFYLYPDGIRVPCKRVDELVMSSKFTDAEKEALEEATGKDFRRIQADHLHKRMAEEKAKSDAVSKRIREEQEAQDRARIQRGKDLFTAGHLIVLKDGTQIKFGLGITLSKVKVLSTLYLKTCNGTHGFAQHLFFSFTEHTGFTTVSNVVEKKSVP